jgi:hypothetical protein
MSSMYSTFVSPELRRVSSACTSFLCIVIGCVPLLPTARAMGAIGVEIDHSNCHDRAAQEVVANLDGISSIVVTADPSELRIIGEANRTDLLASVAPCRRGDDVETHIEIRREGATLHVLATVPESKRWSLFGPSTSSIVSVAVAQGVAVEIVKSYGPTLIRGVARANVRSGTGTLRISDIAGDVVAHNGVGATYIQRIVGNVEAQDGSGEMLISGIGGNLRILGDTSGQLVIHDVRQGVMIDADGSGEIRVTNVSGDVRVSKDGAGEILVSDVGGAFSVAEKSAGAIKYDRVAGPVDVPVFRLEPHRRR